MSTMTGVGETTSSLGDMANKLKNNNLSQESFMTLLLTQLKLQDPMNPFDSTTMMQQMSELTNLASTQGLEKSIRELSTNMGASQVLQASDLIGKHVQVPSSKSPLDAVNGLRGSVVIPDGVENVTVSIKDEHDQVIKTISLDALSDGVLDFSWDGLDASGNQRAPGFYNVSASGLMNGENVALTTCGTFKVNSVANDRNGKGVIINVEGLGGLAMDEIIKIT